LEEGLILEVVRVVPSLHLVLLEKVVKLILVKKPRQNPLKYLRPRVSPQLLS
jgi:hypothetical protein